MKKQRKATTILELQAWKIEEAFNALQKEKSTKICTISKTDDEIVDAEIIDEEAPKNQSKTSEDGTSLLSPQLPWLFPFTTEKLFETARRQPDPARKMFGYFYEAELRKECRQLIGFPLSSGDFYHIQYCYNLLVANGQYFKCAAAIRPILQNYLEKMKEYKK